MAIDNKEDKNLDISYEEKLIEFLGYSVVGPDNSNRWIILDKDNTQVGFIQYKKIQGGSYKKKQPREYGYETHIDGLVQYLNIRKASRKISSYDQYKLKYKNTNFSINFGQIPSLQIWDDEFVFLDFNISDAAKIFYFHFKSKTENYNLEETVSVKVASEEDKKKNYRYYLAYCDSSLTNVSNGDYDVIDIDFLYEPSFNTLTIKEKVKIGDECTKREDAVHGTIEEAINQHKMGIDAFSHFRYIVSKLLPFNEDAIGYILQDYELAEEFKLFVPDLIEDSKTYKLEKSSGTN